jgi:hypothetical protein
MMYRDVSVGYEQAGRRLETFDPAAGSMQSQNIGLNGCLSHRIQCFC